MLRAAETLAVVITLAILVFSSLHLSISAYDSDAYTEPLNHVGALYLSVTSATTVGFGDVAPSSDLARVVAIVQMVVNVLVFGIGIKLVVNAGRRRKVAA